MERRATIDEIRRVIGDITESEKALLASRQAVVEIHLARVQRRQELQAGSGAKG